MSYKMSKLGRAPWVLSQYLKEFPSPIVVKMKIMCVHIDEELNTSTIDFQGMTRDSSLCHCTTLNPPKNLVAFG